MILSLEALYLPPSSGNPPSHLLIALHGWGANAHDLVSLAAFLHLPHYGMFFPNAPYEHPYSPTGRSWYDLEAEDYTGLPESRQQLLDWLQETSQTAQIPPSRIVLCGFSQGGAMTLDVGLALPCAALCSLSGYLHAPPQATPPLPPVFMAHGRLDRVVPIQQAQQARTLLTQLGVKLDYHEFNMAHEIQHPVIQALQQFLDREI
ncbi:hypothetical protein K4A83_03885 [Spirulina subsalsa FACHB-351]|uniref:Phospholipase/carboxylesterase/thioesterase domain-containing protein n=1 Tax=Spirulina subsalsa FACHB-351 TaxID=234711 RepID=A0ABT3L1U5_9CYAN|nr:hypothetical protein [Spirulina subsalsa FACHB-351]